VKNGRDGTSQRETGQRGRASEERRWVSCRGKWPVTWREGWVLRLPPRQLALSPPCQTMWLEAAAEGGSRVGVIPRPHLSWSWEASRPAMQPSTTQDAQRDCVSPHMRRGHTPGGHSLDHRCPPFTGQQQEISRGSNPPSVGLTVVLWYHGRNLVSGRSVALGRRLQSIVWFAFDERRRRRI